MKAVWSRIGRELSSNFMPPSIPEKQVNDG
jgi:hypothetical protein